VKNGTGDRRPAYASLWERSYESMCLYRSCSLRYGVLLPGFGFVTVTFLPNLVRT